MGGHRQAAQGAWLPKNCQDLFDVPRWCQTGVSFSECRRKSFARPSSELCTRPSILSCLELCGTLCSLSAKGVLGIGRRCWHSEGPRHASIHDTSEDMKLYQTWRIAPLPSLSKGFLESRTDKQKGGDNTVFGTFCHLQEHHTQALLPALLELPGIR